LPVTQKDDRQKAGPEVGFGARELRPGTEGSGLGETG